MLTGKSQLIILLALSAVVRNFCYLCKTMIVLTIVAFVVAALCAAYASVAHNRALRIRYRLEASEASVAEMRDSDERFALMARSVMSESARTLSRDSREGLKTLLSPLRTQIADFERRVNEVYSNEARERFALEKCIADLVRANRDVSERAGALASALNSNNRAQGEWGEMILESVLQRSGLRRDVHYQVQTTVGGDDGSVRLRPDVILNLPDNRCLVIDSKASMTAYLRMCEAESESDRKVYLADHLRSVRGHIRELANKNYQDIAGDRKHDLVLMFIPNEGAYLAAMGASQTLWAEAYDNRGLIVSPTHLISVVRLIEQLWRQDDVNRNAARIADEAGRMLNKFADFASDLQRIGSSLDVSRNAYDAAVSKLCEGRGNLVRRAQKLAEMGAKATKSMPESLLRLAEDDRHTSEKGIDDAKTDNETDQ